MGRPGPVLCIAGRDTFCGVENGLLRASLNPDKVSVAAPGEGFDFLGFAYRRGETDLAPSTLRKTKAKIRRRSDALRRWRRKAA